MVNSVNLIKSNVDKLQTFNVLNKERMKDLQEYRPKYADIHHTIHSIVRSAISKTRTNINSAIGQRSVLED